MNEQDYKNLLYSYIIASQKDNAIIDSIMNVLYPCQRKVITSKSRKKVVLTPRQVGKTFTIICYIVLAAIMNTNPDARVVYACDTRDHAKDIIWSRLLRFLNEHGIEYKSNRVELSVTLKNGSTIDLYGVDDEKKASKLRGLQFLLIVVDEVEKIKSDHLRVVIGEEISAGLKTYDGTILLVGTPGPVKSGMFYEVTNDPAKHGYKFFTWNQYDNVDYPVWKDVPDELKKDVILGFLKKIAEEDYGGWDTPAFRREYLGEWCQSEDEYCYHLSEEKNLLQNLLLPSEYTVIIGVDIGYNDDTSFVVTGYSKKINECHVIYSSSGKKLIVNDVVYELWNLIEKYHPIRIVLDTGGGKMATVSIAKEISRRYEVGIVPAEKDKKAAYMLMLDNDFRTGKVKLFKNKMWEQIVDLKKDPKSQIEMLKQKCDYCDALLYAWRYNLHYMRIPLEPKKVISEDPYRDFILKRSLIDIGD